MEDRGEDMLCLPGGGGGGDKHAATGLRWGDNERTCCNYN